MSKTTASRVLERAGVDTLVVLAESASEPDIVPFVGDVHLGECFVIVTSDNRSALGYFTEMEREEAARTGLELIGPSEIGVELLGASVLAAAEKLQIAAGPVALAGGAPAGDVLELSRALAADGWTLVSGTAMGASIRKTKREEHHSEIRRVAGGLCDAFRAVARLLASAEMSSEGLRAAGEPITAGRIRSEVARVFARYRLDQPHGNIVSMGADAGVPHTAGADERQLQAGESLIVDLYPKGWLFADCTRTFCVGEPSQQLAEAHALVLGALEEAHSGAVVGATGWELQKRTCDTFAADGYSTPLHHPAETGYVHGLGHGVGFALHEQPSFRAETGSAGTLESGDVFTLEPGLYDPTPNGAFGVRLEDTVILGDDGLENLTQLPYALDPRAWQSAASRFYPRKEAKE